MSKAKTSASKCPECGGPAYGRGFNHKEGCSEKATSSNSGSSKGFSLSKLKNYDVEELIGIRDRMNEMIQSKSGELEEKIGKLQETLKAIKRS